MSSESRQFPALRVAAVVVVLAVLAVQAVVLPWFAATLATHYPEAAHLSAPTTVAVVLCLVPIQVAALLAWQLPAADERRAARLLAAAAVSLLVGAALTVGTLVWLGAATREFGLQPGVGLALIVLAAAQVAGATVVWGRRHAKGRRQPSDRTSGTPQRVAA